MEPQNLYILVKWGQYIKWEEIEYWRVMRKRIQSFPLRGPEGLCYYTVAWSRTWTTGTDASVGRPLPLGITLQLNESGHDVGMATRKKSKRQQKEDSVEDCKLFCESYRERWVWTATTSTSRQCLLWFYVLLGNSVLKSLSLLHIVQIGSGVHPNCYPIDTGNSFPRVKQSWREANAEAKNT
jgi:hypothetical protein